MDFINIPPDDFSQIYSIYSAILSGNDVRISNIYKNENLILCKDILKKFDIDLIIEEDSVFVKSVSVKDYSYIQENPKDIIDCKSSFLLLNMFFCLCVLFPNYTVVNFDKKDTDFSNQISAIKNSKVEAFSTAKKTFPIILKGIIEPKNQQIDCDKNILFLSFFISLIPLFQNNCIIELKNISEVSYFKKIINFFKFQKIKHTYKQFSYFAIKGNQKYNITNISLNIDELCFGLFSNILFLKDNYNLGIKIIDNNLYFLNLLNKFNIKYLIQDSIFYLTNYHIDFENPNDDVFEIDISDNIDYFIFVLLISIKLKTDIRIKLFDFEYIKHPLDNNISYFNFLNENFTNLKLEFKENFCFFSGKNFHIFNNYTFDCANNIFLTIFYFCFSLLFKDKNLKIKNPKNLNKYFNQYKENISKIIK